jgi:hypothetical protein
LDREVVISNFTEALSTFFGKRSNLNPQFFGDFLMRQPWLLSSMGEAILSRAQGARTDFLKCQGFAILSVALRSKPEKVRIFLSS